MFAAMGYLIGYNGHYDFGEIGGSYIEHKVPYVGLRALPASLNVCNVALMYAIMKQSGYCTLACVVSSCMYIFGKQQMYYIYIELIAMATRRVGFDDIKLI